MQSTAEVEAVLIESEDIRPEHVDKWLMIESALPIIREITADCSIGAFVETQIVSWLRGPSRKAANVEKTAIEQAVEEVFRQVDARDPPKGCTYGG